MNAKIANYNQHHLNGLQTDTTVNQETPKTSFLAKTQPRASWAGLKGYIQIQNQDGMINLRENGIMRDREEI